MLQPHNIKNSIELCSIQSNSETPLPLRIFPRLCSQAVLYRNTLLLAVGNSHHL